MKRKFWIQIFSLLSLFLLSNSLDNHTLSNYKDITLTNLTGLFYPDFDTKIVLGNLTYTFHANQDGKKIILDSKYLNIIVIYEISPENKELNFNFGEKDKNLGIPLEIDCEFNKSQEIEINIVYNTTEEGTAAQFLSKEQTIDKNFSYFFTQSALTIGRELLPSQDTPAVKFPFYLGIKTMNPLRGMISGLYERNETNDDNTTTFYYYQKIPVPNYLIALAAGNIVEEKINDQVSVYSEPGFIEKAVKEFENIPEFLNYSQEYMGEYEWGKYNVLVLPYSFPYSGMENPCLTFCSPCLVNGDKSLVDLIAHELIHSWSGNLVTNENWRDFWLNEGITKFLQRKVIAKWQNDDYAKMDYLLGLSYIAKYLVVFGINSTLTSLRPNLTGLLPDDTFSNIPYEKGSNFIYYLEGIIGADLTQQFFQSYFQNYKYKSVDVFDFQNYFIEFCRNNSVDNETLESIKWHEWIFEPGDCPVPNNFSNKYNDDLNKVMQRFLDGDFDGLDEEFRNLTASAKTVFFLRLEERNIFLTPEQHDFLTNTLELYHDQNYLVTTHYLRLILKETKKFLPNEFECLKQYLTSFGVSDFMDGVYRLFYKRDEVRAVEILNNCSDFYHNIMMNMAKNEIEDAKTKFPIISFDFDDQCLTLANGEENNIIFKEYEEYKNNYPEINITEGVYLKLDEQELALQCHLDHDKSYCSINEDFQNGKEYTLSVPERIQEKEFAVKQLEGKKINLYWKNKPSQDNVKQFSIDYKMKDSAELTIKFDNLYNYENSIKITSDNKEIQCSNLFDDKEIKCKIDKTNFNYDNNDKNHYKTYKLEIKDVCGKTIYSIEIMAKRSEDDDDDDDDGLKGWHIALICVGGTLFLLIVLFFVCRCCKKGNDIEVNEVKNEQLLI